MTTDLIKRHRHIECPPTKELLNRLKGNLEYGGQGRMETATLRIVFQCAFDIMDDGGAFDSDYRSSVGRFTAARIAFANGLGAHFGNIGAKGGGDQETGIPLHALYTEMTRRMPKRIMSTLTMLTDPLPAGAEIELYRNYLYPQKPYAEEALTLLELTLDAIRAETEEK